MENKLFRIENNILIEYYPQDTNKFWFKIKKHIVKIPDNVIEIADRAFEKCMDIKAVIIPKSVKRIGAYAFHDSHIETLIIEDGVEVIEERAFASCKFLSNIYLGSSIKILKKGAFQWCANISTILLPKNTEELYDEVFESSNFLLSVYMHRKLEYYGVRALPPFHYLPLNGIFTLKESFAEMYATEMCKKSTIISDEDFENVREAIYNHCIASLDVNLTRRQINLMLFKADDLYLDDEEDIKSITQYKILLVKNDGEVLVSEGLSELLLGNMNLNSVETTSQLHEKLLYQICGCELDEWECLLEDDSEIFRSIEEIQFLNEVSKIKNLNDIAYIEMHTYTYSNCQDYNMRFDWNSKLYLNEQVLKYDFNERKYLIKKWM